MRKFWEPEQRAAVLAKVEGRASTFDPDADMWPEHTTLRLRDRNREVRGEGSWEELGGGEDGEGYGEEGRDDDDATDVDEAP